jgi:dynein heavy chain
MSALQYLVGQLNYGGRVTDFFDLRACQHILKGFFCEEMLTDNYSFDSQGVYKAPPKGADFEDYLKCIDELPAEDAIEVFGLHDNVKITAAIKETANMMETILSVQPRTAGGGGGLSRDEIVAQLATDIEARLPEEFDIEAAAEKFPVIYENSMNTVLVQELIRFNKLLAKIKETLKDVQKAIKGLVVMSASLEAMTNSMFDGRVPALWTAVSYPSLKPLSTWVNDFIARLAFMAKWIVEGAPGVFWLSGFFFTQSFLTGTLQNYARKHKTPIDELGFHFKVRTDIQPDQEEGPEDGSYIYGLFLEGARWDSINQTLAEPFKRQLTSEMPVIWLIPCQTSKIPHNELVYPCPLYKTSARRGVLSTTGRSTNFVLAINLPSKHDETHWVKRGLAMISQLDD